MRMNFLLCALSAFALIWAQNASGQVGNPAVSSGLRFEEYPVDLSTGLPKVTLPLYSMPTRSKDITIEMSLNYHQSSVGFFGRRSGNCGRGWNLSAGGAVQKKEVGTNVYNFNFMGFSGKLIAYPVFNTPGTGYASITENSGRKLDVSIETSISTDFTEIKITAFVFTDDKGNTYRFEAFDIINIETYTDGVRNITAERWSFQLTDIYDTNRLSENNYKGRNLAHFKYFDYNEQVKFGQFSNEVTKNNTLRILDEVIVDGYGSIKLDHGSLPDQTLSRPGENGIWIHYSGLTIKDFLNNKIKSFIFNANGDYDVDGKLNLTLLSVSEYGTDSLDPQIYRLFYRDMTVPVVGANVVGADAYGYRNLYDKWCENNTEIVQKVNKDKVAEGVLEKITFPTGGCAIYEYESGTMGVSSADPEYYYNLYDSSMWHNYIITEVGTLSTNFNVPQNTEVYFKFHGAEGPNNLGGVSMPSFTLTANESTLVKSFNAPYNNGDNNCLGYKMTLTGSTTYRISKSAFGLFPSASVYTMTRVPVPKKWIYGGGIRVKTIAYFDVDAPKEYFYPSQTPSAITPSKIQYYKYNIFGDVNSSSGQGTSTGDSAPVIYSNVTVSDVLADNKSRTEFSFYSPSDFVNPGNYESDFRSGKIKSKKVYNNQNVLQLETAYEYDSIVSDNSGAGADLYKMGWMMLKQSLTKEYLGTSLGTSLETKENFDYDTNRNISKSTVASSRSSESLITNYYYHLNEAAGGQPYLGNRVSELERVEKFVGTTPVSKTKIEYGYNWLNSNGVSVNRSFLLNKTSFAKGSGVLEVRTTNNLYDQYGNVLESEQTGGIKTSSIWGYNGTLLIASIQNVPYNSIPSALITAAQVASDSGNEANLLTALTALRNTPVLANALVTTYTYKPLIGVSSVTDTRGYKMTFEYDTKGREKKTKDQDGNIITEKFYNTKPQN